MTTATSPSDIAAKLTETQRAAIRRRGGCGRTLRAFKRLGIAGGVRGDVRLTEMGERVRDIVVAETRSVA